MSDKRTTTSPHPVFFATDAHLLSPSKYEEFRPPEVGDICYIMDNAYSRDEILEQEVKVLNLLKFEVTVPSPLTTPPPTTSGLMYIWEGTFRMSAVADTLPPIPPQPSTSQPMLPQRHLLA